MAVNNRDNAPQAATHVRRRGTGAKRCPAPACWPCRAPRQSRARRAARHGPGAAGTWRAVGAATLQGAPPRAAARPAPQSRAWRRSRGPAHAWALMLSVFRQRVLQEAVAVACESMLARLLNRIRRPAKEGASCWLQYVPLRVQVAASWHRHKHRGCQAGPGWQRQRRRSQGLGRRRRSHRLCPRLHRLPPQTLRQMRDASGPWLWARCRGWASFGAKRQPQRARAHGLRAPAAWLLQPPMQARAQWAAASPHVWACGLLRRAEHARATCSRGRFEEGRRRGHVAAAVWRTAHAVAALHSPTPASQDELCCRPVCRSRAS